MASPMQSTYRVSGGDEHRVEVPCASPMLLYTHQSAGGLRKLGVCLRERDSQIVSHTPRAFKQCAALAKMFLRPGQQLLGVFGIQRHVFNPAHCVPYREPTLGGERCAIGERAGATAGRAARRDARR